MTLLSVIAAVIRKSGLGSRLFVEFDLWLEFVLRSAAKIPIALLVQWSVEVSFYLPGAREKIRHLRHIAQVLTDLMWELTWDVISAFIEGLREEAIADTLLGGNVPQQCQQLEGRAGWEDDEEYDNEGAR